MVLSLSEPSESEWKKLKSRLTKYFNNYSGVIGACQLVYGAHSLVDKWLLKKGICNYDGNVFPWPAKNSGIYAKAHSLVYNSDYR